MENPAIDNTMRSFQRTKEDIKSYKVIRLPSKAG